MDNQDPEEVIEAMFPDPEDDSGESERCEISPRQNPTVRIKALSELLCGTFRVSNKGVPHIIVRCIAIERSYSVAYFGKSKTWRVFFPYMEFDVKQTKWDFKTEDEVLKFFEEIPR